MIRRVVREELNAIHGYLPRLISNQDKEIRYRLHFRNKLPKQFFTFHSILAEDGMKLQIALMDSNLREVITSDPLSSARVEIVVIKGDFVRDRHEYWTEKQFKDHVLPQRDGKGPLLKGELIIKLNEGVGYLADATFTDNSSWTRSQTFRLAVKPHQSACIENRVQEGISEPFRVKDRRVESNQKHDSPSLTDEVWRLNSIMKGGKYHKRLMDGGIHTVQQFLQAFNMNHEGLRSLLGNKAKEKEIPNTWWHGILTHAQKCPLGNERYSYSVSGYNVVPIFNSIYELIGAKFDGHYYSMGDLAASQQKLLDNLKKLAFENPSDIHIMVDNLPQPITLINAPSVPGSSSLDPQIPYGNGKNHDEAATQVGLWHQPNAPYNEPSDVFFGLEDISTAVDRVHPIQGSCSFQEPDVLYGLPVGSIPGHLSTAIDAPFPGLILPEPQNSDYPATNTDEAPTDMGFQQPLQEIPYAQDFSLVQLPAIFHEGVTHMNQILDDDSFRTDAGRVDEFMFEGEDVGMGESSSGRVDESMIEDEDQGMGERSVQEYLNANLPTEAVPTSPRKWFKVIAGLKCGISISKYLAAKRLQLFI